MSCAHAGPHERAPGHDHPQGFAFQCDACRLVRWAWREPGQPAPATMPGTPVA